MPGVGDLHGQGLRARRLQQQGLHLGQDGPARPGAVNELGRVSRPGIGALGDIHGEFEAARAIVARHPDVPFWLCVGDIADEYGRYESLGARVYWIHGNNDNFDAIAAGELPPDLHHIDNGTLLEVFDRGEAVVQVAGLGGTFAPTWYETPAADLPHPTLRQAQGRSRRSQGAEKGSATELAAPSTRSAHSRSKSRDDKRRHFVREEVDACKALGDVDVFLTHEAAKPFRPYPGNRGPDAGKVQINDILAAMKPRLHLFGHHHRFSDDIREGVRSVGLDLVTRSYVLIDVPSLDISLRTL